jgi:hypothetical protein
LNDTDNFEHIADGYFESSIVLPLGEYPLQVNITDSYDNVESTDFTITVHDTTAPSLNSPIDMVKEYTTSGTWLEWTCYDLIPDYFIISRNGTEIKHDAWNGTNLKVRLDGLDLGVYSFHLFVNDTSGQSSEDEVLVFVSDLIVPIIDHPADIWLVEGIRGVGITWTPSDLFPSSYSILIDGYEVESGPWNGSSIFYSLDGLNPGTYNYTILVTDINRNSVSDYVQVVVIELIFTTTQSTTTTTSSPTASTTSQISVTTTSTIVSTSTTPSTSVPPQTGTDLFDMGLILVGVLAGLAIIVGLINIRLMRNQR